MNMAEEHPLPNMEKQQTALGKQDNVPASGTPPAFFVILQQPQGSGKLEQGILVSDREASSVTSSVPANVPAPVKSNAKSSLAADCNIAGITVVLDNNTMWNEFYRRNTEMILTKQGRRMFPYCRYWITGLDPNLKYILVMDISPVDNQRYKWNGRWWESSGKAEPHVLGRVFIHPESPSTGQYWMHQPVSFYKLKLTNNTLDQEGHIILHSMHRYLPRLHLVPADKATEVIQLNGPDVHTFTFPQTEFFAVTAYQNIQITQLKIDYNPFAKGFREDSLAPRPLRDILAKVRSDLEGASGCSSPGTRGHLESDWMDSLRRGEGSSFGSQDQLDIDIDKESFNAERDFLDFLNPDLAIADAQRLKQEIIDSPVPSCFDDGSRVTSPLDPNRPFNVALKDEPEDNYDYGKALCTDGVVVKQEDSEEEDTDEYSNSDDDYPILERQLMKKTAMERASDYSPSKRPLSSPSGVAKAKMLKLDSGKLPVVYLEPCSIAKGTRKVSDLEDEIVPPITQDQLPAIEVQESFSAEERWKSNIINSREIKGTIKKTLSEQKKQQKSSLPKEQVGKISETSQSVGKPKTPCIPRDSADGLSISKVCKKRKSAPVLKNDVPLKDTPTSQPTTPVSPVRKGRPRKPKITKISKAGRPPKKSLEKHLETSKNSILAEGGLFTNGNLDLEDVDGVLFVSFVSKEALDIHTVDIPVDEKGLKSLLTPSSAVTETGDLGKILQLEMDLLEDLKSLRYKQVIHPALQEVGLKLGFVDPALSIDLKYLGVQLPLAYFSSHDLWNNGSPATPDTGYPFISRTGKTNDFTKIKGWRDKFSTNISSRNEGGISGGPVKNRSAFCSDKLDEYLENEAKLMETDMELAPSELAPPVNYQLPTKSTSYVRTLDSVLKKQSTPSPSSTCTLKPQSLSSAQKKPRARSKPAATSPKAKRVYKPILPAAVTVKEKLSLHRVLEKTLTSLPINPPTILVDRFLLLPLDDSMLPKQISLSQTQQHQPNFARHPGLSKSHLKLIDLEECAVWDGKPRTYITEERADIALVTLLTAQVSLRSKPAHKIIRRRAPPCNNEFCRLGCICASISQEKRQPTHCRRPECMFGCTCLKRKVVLVKGGSKHKKILKKEVNDNLLFSSSSRDEPQPHQEEEDDESEKEENSIDGDHKLKKKIKLEYTICDTEPEEPIRRSFSIWEKGESEEDPEPIYIPTPSVIEPVKCLALPHPEVTSSLRSKLSCAGKPGRAYTPKPNPVIRDEDKDPVYLYFESMMTCARVRPYERKTKEQKKQEQQEQCTCSSEQCNAKEHDPELQQKRSSSKMETGQEKPADKGWRLSHSESDTPTSYIHKITSAGPTKLIEIISDCNWEEERIKILNILSQHMNSNMPRSLKVGSYIVELASESKTRDEKNPPLFSSRVKISMPSCQDKDKDAEMPEPETSSVGDLQSCRTKEESLTILHDDPKDKLQEKLNVCKGLPFYAGLSPAGRLIANKHTPNSNPSGLVQVNGKSYPQAKLLLGQMGALHPANRLAAYITGRLRPTVLDLSTLSTVISKISSSSKTSTTAATSVSMPSVTFSTSTPSASNATTVTIAASRPPSGGVFTQFVMNKVGAMQQKIPVVSTPQSMSESSQKFSINPTSIMVVTPVAPSRSCQVFTTTPSTRLPTLTTLSPTLSAPVFSANTPVSRENTNEVVSATLAPTTNPAFKEIPLSSPGITPSPPHFGVAVASQTTNTISPTTLTSPLASTTKGTVMRLPTTPVTPITSLSFARSIISTSAIPLPVTTTAPAVLSTTIATSLVTTSASSGSGSSVGTMPILLSGMSSLSQKPGAVSQAGVAVSSPPVLSPGTEKRMGPRLLLIPVHSGSPTVRPVQNVQIAQGQRMILQPFRNPGGVNLFRHPNGQIIQLVPLQQMRAAGAQHNVQHLMLRNPGSAMGIQLPLPSKIPDASMSRTASTSLAASTSSTFVLSSPPVTNTTVANMVSTSSAITQSTTSVSSVPSFVSQAGTLTLRISPPTASSLAPGQASANSKIITHGSAQQPRGTASLIPLQSGSFALLQLPGHKTIPSSILNHAASLQLLKNTQAASQKEQPDLNKQQEELKTSTAEVVTATVPKNTFLDSKCEQFFAEKLVACDSTDLAINLQGELDCALAQDMCHGPISEVLDDIATYPEKTHDSKLPKDTVKTNDTGVQASAVDQVDPEEQKDNLEHKTKERWDPVHFGELKYAVTPTRSGEHIYPVESMHSGEKEDTQSSREQNNTESKNLGEQDGAALFLCQTKSRESLQAENRNEQICANQPSFILLNMQEKGNTGKPESQDNKCFSQLGDSEKHVNSSQSLCPDQQEAKSGGSSKDAVLVSKMMHEASASERSLTVKETKTLLRPEQGFTGVQAESRVSERESTESRVTSHLLVSENMSVNKKDMSINPEEASKGSLQLSVLDKNTHVSSEMKKTVVHINIDDDDEEYEEEDDKSDDSADDFMDDVPSDLQSEEDMDVEMNEPKLIKDDEEQVDIETVEEFSEKINIARLKATAASIGPSKQQCNLHNPATEEAVEKGKKLSIWNKKPIKEVDAFSYYRQTHTANERRRRNEMRDLFETMKKALGLNLPKVSKCYILSQAYDEIQGLTDQADKLIGQKNLLTRKQDILIRKVSALSGKTEEVVLKKLEYIYAKQKALDAERKKRQMGEEELAQQLRPSRLLKQELSLESFRDVDELTMTNHKRGKPLILARKTRQVEETATSTFSLSGASLVMTPEGQVLSLKNTFMPGPVTSLPSTIFQADFSSQATCNTLTSQQGITSMMIQLPGTSVPIQVKGIITSSSIPITLSTVTSSTIVPTMSTTAKLTTENEDLFMMPKIVNVTSLANEPGMGLDLGVERRPSASAVIKAPEKPPRNEAKLGEENVFGKVSPVTGGEVAEDCGIEDSSTGTQSAQVSMNGSEPGFTQILNVDSTKNTAQQSFPEKLYLGDFQGEKQETNVGSEQLQNKDSQFHKLSKDFKDSRTELELKKVASAMEEASLDQSELMSGIEEHDDTDETLTSLLNEIAFLNQQLNNDTPSLSVSPEFSLGHSESRGGTTELTVGDASSVPFGSFKELFELRENKSSISPLLLQLEESDLQSGERHSGEPLSERDILNVIINSKKETSQPNSDDKNKCSSFLADTASVSPPPVLQKKTNQDSGSTDTLWRPMPKLAPLGLKVCHLPTDQEGQGNKVMPALAPVTTKSGPHWLKVVLPAAEQEGQGTKAMPLLSPVVAKLNSEVALPSTTTDK